MVDKVNWKICCSGLNYIKTFLQCRYIKISVKEFWVSAAAGQTEVEMDSHDS